MSMSMFLRKADLVRGQEQDEKDFADWLDEMAQFNGEQIWSDELKCWVWADDGQPVNPK